MNSCKGLFLLVLASGGLMSIQVQAQVSCQVLNELAAEANALSRGAYDTGYFMETEKAMHSKFVSNIYIVVERDMNAKLDASAGRLQSAWMRMDSDGYVSAVSEIKTELLTLQDKRC